MAEQVEETWTPIRPLRYDDAAKAYADFVGLSLEGMEKVKPTGKGHTIIYDDVVKYAKDNNLTKPTKKEATKPNG